MAELEFKNSDIFETEAEALVNTVNCVGVMGRGLALQFKKRYPDNFKVYKAACDRDEVVPGKMFVHQRMALDFPKFIINFPTKRHWRGKSRIEDIQSGMKDLSRLLREHQIRSVAIPPLGAGLGGLHWPDVKAIIISELSGLDNLRVFIHEPGNAPIAEKMGIGKDVPNMTDGRAALIMMMKTYTDGLMEPDPSLLEVHKLMYFLQESGQPLRLKYVAHNRGPYAENLRHVLNKIEGHFISGYGDGGDAPDKALELIPGALEDAQQFIQDQPEVGERIERVRKLVEGYETQYALELLASVHWLAKTNQTIDLDEIVAKLADWSPRKAGLYGERQVSIALNTLIQQGWLTDKSMQAT